MPQYTLLDLVQNILSAMDSDEVNSISDTTEALQVAEVVKTTYYDLVTTSELPRDDHLFQLTPSTDPAKPVLMYLPQDVQDVRWLKYDKHTVDDTRVTYQPVIPIPLVEFIEMSTSLNPSDGNILTYTHSVGSTSWTLYARNDVAPRYYTTTNDREILFDSYDSAVDTTLQGSKTMGFGQRSYDWISADTFVPPLDDKQMQRLLHEAKALAFAELKQQQHAKAEKSAREIKINQQSSKHKIPTYSDYDQVENMGRRPTGWSSPTGRYK